MSDDEPIDAELADVPPSSASEWPSDEWPWPEYSPELEWFMAQPFELHEQILCAQASFSEFARAVELERFRIVPVYEAVGIKAFFPCPGKYPLGENIFLTDVYTDGMVITATLNAAPFFSSDLKEGDVVTVPIARLSDWFIVQEGNGIGGFTFDFIWSELSTSDQKLYANEPPFAWFKHRRGQSAANHLAGLRKCGVCGKRNFVAPFSISEVCGICTNKGSRKNCPMCGAPLIRFGDLPSTCARCTSK